MKYYLVINLGLRSIRVILFDKAAHIIERNWYPVQTVINGGTVEQNPEEWWVLCKRLLKELSEKNPSYLENLQSVSVASSASCLVVLDKNGNPLINSLIVSDKRATKESSILKKSV